MEKFIKENGDSILAIFGILLTYFGLIIPIIKYLKSRRFEFHQKTFNNYHKIIQILVQPTDGGIFLDRQVAAIFELRNFPDYYPVTQRILGALRDQWNQPPGNPRLINEIDLTMNYIAQSNCKLWAVIKRIIFSA